ncbi:MAG TPA: hypothetical protein VJU02_08080 [Nitrospiraceae bacterium]|nr:hypothetical protein [Nitrospiraceae bacterium]
MSASVWWHARPLGDMFIVRYQNKPEGRLRRLLHVRDKESSGVNIKKARLGSDSPG